MASPPPPPHPSPSLKEHCNNALYKMLAHNIYGATIQLTIHILLFFSGGQSILMTMYNQWCQLQPLGKKLHSNILAATADFIVYTPRQLSCISNDVSPARTTFSQAERTRFSTTWDFDLNFY